MYITFVFRQTSLNHSIPLVTSRITIYFLLRFHSSASKQVTYLLRQITKHVCADLKSMARPWSLHALHEPHVNLSYPFTHFDVVALFALPIAAASAALYLAQTTEQHSTNRPNHVYVSNWKQKYTSCYPLYITDFIFCRLALLRFEINESETLYMYDCWANTPFTNDFSDRLEWWIIDPVGVFVKKVFT